jgi:hypothetical protein
MPKQCMFLLPRWLGFQIQNFRQTANPVTNAQYQNTIVVTSQLSMQFLFFLFNYNNKETGFLTISNWILQKMSTDTWISSEIKLVQNAGTAYLGQHFLATFIGKRFTPFKDCVSWSQPNICSWFSAWLSTCILKQTQGWVCNQWQVQLRRSSVQSCTSLWRT